MSEARWQEQNWFDQQISTAHPDFVRMPNVGVHYLLWRVQKWLVPQINRSLDALKANMEDGYVNLPHVPQLCYELIGT